MIFAARSVAIIVPHRISAVNKPYKLGATTFVGSRNDVLASSCGRRRHNSLADNRRSHKILLPMGPKFVRPKAEILLTVLVAGR